jgi:uncharacterized membrane protein
MYHKYNMRFRHFFKHPALVSIFTLRLSRPGIISAALFFALSLLPTLVPRSVLVQAVGSGIAIAIGYGLGVLARWLISYLDIPFKKHLTSHVAMKITIGVVALMVLSALWQFVSWQNEIRSIFGVELITPPFLVPVMLLAIIIFVILLVIGRIIRLAYRAVVTLLDRFLSRRLSVLLGSAIAILLVFFTLNGVIIKGLFDAANESYSYSNSIIDPTLQQPQMKETSGSPESLVSWESLGRNGRMFVTSGPTASQIEEVNNLPALQPIRSYVGLDSKDTLEERSSLLLEELKRAGAFERKSLLITTSVGDGWLDAQAVDPFEYVNNGDTAIAGLQYSYLPSALSLFADAEDVKLSSQKVFADIYRYWLTLPEDNRPDIYMYGLSLGSYGVEEVLNSVELFNAPIRGALLAGPPFINHFHKEVIANRTHDSPVWQPTINNGNTVRFTGKDYALDTPPGQWGNTRIVYMQQPTDPIVWFSGDLIYKSPEWLEEGQRGPGISEDFIWIPIVTAYQIGLDMILSFSFPAGYGHNYAPSSNVDAWADITRPDNWTKERADTIKAQFKN